LSNSDTADFQLSQFGAWFFLCGLETRLESLESYDICWVETIETELDRVQQWDRDFGGFYKEEYYTSLREQIAAVREWCEAADSDWYARQARGKFRLIEGGLSGNLSQTGINE
jgi:hypothetical protein